MNDNTNGGPDEEPSVTMDMARSIHEAIATYGDAREEGPFGDAMAALVLVMIGVIATAPEAGDYDAYRKAAHMVARQLIQGLCDTNLREEALAMIPNGKAN